MSHLKGRVLKVPHHLGALILSGAAVLILHACGSDNEVAAVPVVPAATMIEGTVAVGAAVPGATVTIMDADAATADVTGVADANGA